MWLFYHKYRLRKKSSWNATLEWENGRGKKIVNCLFAIIQFTQVICRHRLFERFVMRNYIFNFYPVPVRYFWTEFSRVGSSLIFPYPIKARFPSRLIHTNCCWASCALHLEKRLNPRSLEFLSFLWTTTLSILFYQRSVYKKNNWLCSSCFEIEKSKDGCALRKGGWSTVRWFGDSADELFRRFSILFA